MSKKKTDERITRVIKELNDEYVDGTIKEIEVPPLINTKTGKQTGYAVIVYLSSKYDYTDDFFDLWREKFGAVAFSVSAKRNLVKVKFTIRY